MDSSTFHDKASASNPTGHSQHDVYNQDGGGRIRYQDSTHLTHENPREREPNIKTKCVNAAVCVGAYNLNDRQIGMMQSFLPCVINPSDVMNAPHKPNVETQKNRSGNRVYYLTYKPAKASKSCNLESPEVGMVRVTYEAVIENGHITTVGVQDGSTFRPFTEEDATQYESGACGLCEAPPQRVVVLLALPALSNEESGGYGDDDIENDEDNGVSLERPRAILSVV